MAWFKIVAEGDGSYIRHYENRGQHLTRSYFSAEELTPLARHESIPNPPSLDHTYDGVGWVIDVSGLKEGVLDQVKERALERINDLENDVDKALMKPVWLSFKSNLQSALTQADVELVRTTALAAVDGV